MHILQSVTRIKVFKLRLYGKFCTISIHHICQGCTIHTMSHLCATMIWQMRLVNSCDKILFKHMNTWRTSVMKTWKYIHVVGLLKNNEYYKFYAIFLENVQQNAPFYACNSQCFPVKDTWVIIPHQSAQIAQLCVTYFQKSRAPDYIMYIPWYLLKFVHSLIEASVIYQDFHRNNQYSLCKTMVHVDQNKIHVHLEAITKLNC